MAEATIARQARDGRRTRRVATDLAVSVREQGRHGTPTRLIDLSRYGFRIDVHGLAPDSIVWLRLPDAEQIRSRSAGEADVQVREQRSAWREGRSLAGSSRQLDATRRANAGAAPEQAESKDNLRLVSGEAGKAKGLAILSPERNPAFPDIPTIKESIGSDYSLGEWRGVAGPKGMDPAVVAKLEDALEKAYNSEFYQDFMKRQGFGVEWHKGEDFKKFLVDNNAYMGGIIEKIGMKK